jgi:hypothetical protein
MLSIICLDVSFSTFANKVINGRTSKYVLPSHPTSPQMTETGQSETGVAFFNNGCPGCACLNSVTPYLP